MSEPPVTLHVDRLRVSPYAMSAFVSLTEAGVPFRIETVDLDAGAQHAPPYAATSLTRRVPTLVQGDFRLSESSAIAEYLQDTVDGARLYPRDARARALARQVQAWLRSDLVPIREERSTETVFLRRADAPLSDRARQAAGRLADAAGALLAHGGPNLFGDWCIADTDLAVMLNRLVLNDDPVPAPLADYARRQWQRPSVQRWVGFERPSKAA